MTSPGIPESSISRPRVLCVDDDAVFLNVFTFFLKDIGFDVLSTSDPHYALELASSSPAPDLAIVDFEMPRYDGIKLASLLKNLKPDLGILLFSGSPEVATINSPSIDATYSKGENVAGLVAKIRELTPTKHRRRGLTVAW